MSVDVDALSNEVEQFLNRQQTDDTERASGTRGRSGKSGRKSALEFFGTDPDRNAKEGKLDPVVGPWKPKLSALLLF